MNESEKKFLLVSTIPQKMSAQEAFQDLAELTELVHAYQGKVIEIITQNREVHDKGLYIGSGKVTEIGAMLKDKQIGVVVLNAIVKPGHILEISNELSKYKRDIKVWDRVDLILKIFSAHAKTREARLQIDLAAMRHMGPRIYGMGKVLSQQGGGIGTRGIGETNTELMKRHWRSQMKEVRDKLEKLADARKRQIEHRQRLGLKTASIVGYTNAGKTSLYNLLTSKKNYTKNALFATLDSSVTKIELPNHTEVLLADTIGFIKNLPPHLIEAFKSTLMESIYADVIIHVIDVTDADLERKIEAVEDIFTDLNLWNKKFIYVFNKIDSWDQNNKSHLLLKYQNYSPTFVSAKKDHGIPELVQAISEKL